MLSLYEILKASKTGIVPDMWTALAGMSWGGADSGHEVKELTGIPPLSFRAYGTPLLDYLISGNTVQNGTPTPSNPVEVNGVGVRTGNLCPTTWVQGDIDSATGANDVSNDAIRSDFIPIEQNKYYSIYRSIKGGFVKIRLYDNSKAYVGSGTNRISLIVGGAGATPTNPLNGTDNFCCIQIISSSAKYMRIVDTTNNLSTAYMFVEGEYTAQTMPSYEPYGYKIPISNGQQTTNIYLGNVQSERKIDKLVLTGDENWIRTATDATHNRYQLTVSDMLPFGTRLTPMFCTHYQNICDGRSIGDVPNNSIYSGQNQDIYIKTTSITSLTDFKAYLAAQYSAGTPVTAWYILATPETAAVNEPLMKIGNYADTVSMEQAGVSIPTLNGQTVVDVETELKPSEMYIKYQK